MESVQKSNCWRMAFLHPFHCNIIWWDRRNWEYRGSNLRKAHWRLHFALSVSVHRVRLIPYWHIHFLSNRQRGRMIAYLQERNREWQNEEKIIRTYYRTPCMLSFDIFLHKSDAGFHEIKNKPLIIQWCFKKIACERSFGLILVGV